VGRPRDLVFQRGLEVARAAHLDCATAVVSPYGGDVAATFRRSFADHPLDTTARRLELLSSPAKALARSDDPWVKLAIALDAEVLAPARAHRGEREAEWVALMPAWMKAWREFKPGLGYPDANSTLRVTWGRVEPYETYSGAITSGRTWLSELLAKHATDAYEAPAWLVDAAPSALTSPWVDPVRGDLPIAFLSSVDTTGGNSGSATLDAQGRLVGLVYDGNYEAMAADWIYDPRYTRTIHVDIRYVLWLLSVTPDAAWILRELGM
ncbi:MAG TPA: S46 family peptidase, partial [Myxococcota bacterium]|nr:S46 family peptidase [Myxococcota bacterium]